MKASQRDATIAACSVAFLLDDWISQRFNLPSVDIPDLREDTPEVAASTLRQHWSLGESPIKNMVHLLEVKGVRVFSLSENCKEVDACSLWHGGTPYVFLNVFKSAERSRFDAAHELGHLVLHQHAAPGGRQAEDEANAFAASFLMPEDGFRGSAPSLPRVSDLVYQKARWTVSVAAFAHRLHSTGIISDWHYRRLCIEISKRGYRTKEPKEAARERSQIWEKVFSSLRSEKVEKPDIARELMIPIQEITDLVFGLVTTGISSSPDQKKAADGNRNHLRLV